MSISPPSAWLVPRPGCPPLGRLEVRPSLGGAILGRDAGCDLRLPEHEGSVSRRHARLAYRGGRWFAADLGSSWGTRLNGVRLVQDQELPLTEGDALAVGPWTFDVRIGRPPDRSAETAEDSATATRVYDVDPDPARGLGRDLLRLLIEGASAVHAAADEPAVAAALADLASRGTGLPNAAVLGPMDAGGRVAVLGTVGFAADADAARSAGHPGPPATPQAEPMFSRSLVAAAWAGRVAFLLPGGGPAAPASALRLGIHTALCVPLAAGPAVMACLYLDGRCRDAAGNLPRDAVDYCAALGQLGGLAISNLRRAAIERRAAVAEAELRAAAVVQQWALPKGPTRSGPFECVGRCRPCGFLGGDFYHAFALPGGRLVVAIGDASGHDPAAAVLTTVALGYLHAALAANPDPSAAVAGLNAFLLDRRPSDKFLTLWVGVFDPGGPGEGPADQAAGTAGMTLRYVDAGHGHARLVRPDGTTEPLTDEGGPAVGASADESFPAGTAALPPGGRVVLFSDGLVEQPGPTGPSQAEAAADGEPGGEAPAMDRFGLNRLLPLLAAADPADVLEVMFAAVTRLAGTDALADDATAVVVHWA